MSRPNIASEIRGIIPRIVVPEAIIAGLNLDEEADNRASTGSNASLDLSSYLIYKYNSIFIIALSIPKLLQQQQN